LASGKIMGLLLAFAPFIGRGGDRFGHLLVREWATRGRSPKALEIATMRLFGRQT
jgi:hypothetical protein